MIITKNNLKSPHIFVMWILFSLIGSGFLYYYFQTKKLDFLYISTAIFLFLFILFLIGFSTKIELTRKEITYKSIIKKHSIRWDEIQTIGVYKINKYSINLVEPKDYSKFSLLGQKFIFLSKDKNFIPKKNQKFSSNFIDMHYREEVWNEILKNYKK